MSGTLYLVATPIGNLGDFSPRAEETLRQVDFIAAEDTRVSLRLLNHFEIKKPLVSYHEHNQQSAGSAILDRLLAGESCALVTDAGTPAISDPGEGLVRLCAGAGVEVLHPRLLRGGERPGRQRPAHPPLHLRGLFEHEQEGAPGTSGVFAV